MRASISTTTIRGREVELLPCGCSPLRSRGRTRCEEAKKLHAVVARLDVEARKATAGEARMAVMGRKARVYAEYREHLTPASRVAKVAV